MHIYPIVTNLSAGPHYFRRRKLAIDDTLRQTIREIVREELDLLRQQEPKKGKCAWCEGEYPEDALNYSSGDPACASCHAMNTRLR